MWVTRLLRAPGVELRRFILLLTATLIVATFALVGPLSNSAYAADAVWDGTELTYEDNLYVEVTAPPNQSNLPNEYQWIDSSTQPNTAHVLYFGPDNPGQATSATLITYDFSGSSYTNPSSPTTISVSRDPMGSPEGGQTAGTTCTMTGGLGWILCPISNYLADGIDAVYGIVANFFNVQTINRTDNGVYQFWKVMQSFANAAFIAVFIAIIYSQITGAGYSNYNIKTMLPRLILGSILVNISFWICALAVDASNLLGYNLQSILVNIRENIPTTADTGEGPGWSALTTAVLAGGGVAGYAWMSASIATSTPALGFILLTFLIPAALSVLTAFIVLAARQALIVVLTAISPLAFVAFILPGTRELFNKWRKLFTSMLIMFPAFALLFGGSQIAAAAIINTSESAQGIMKFIIILVGLAVQIIPLALTPLLSRLSTGILGQITNMVNNKEKGLADRAKTWAQDNADMHKSRKLRNMAKKRDDIQNRLRERAKNGEKLSRWNRHQLNDGYYGASRLALRMDQKKREREAHKKLSEDTLSGMHERDWNARHNDPKSRLDRRTASHRNTAYNLQKQAEREKGAFEANSELGWNKYEASKSGSHYRKLREQAHVTKGVAKVYDDDMTNADELALKSLVNSDKALRVKAKRAAINAKAASAHQESIDAAAGEDWVRIQQKVPGYRTMRTETDHTKKRTEDIDKSMTAADQRTYDELVKNAATPQYSAIKDAKKQTIVDTSLAQFDANLVTEEGNREYRRLFEDGVAGSRELRKQNVQIEQLKKESGEVDAILQERADAHWEGESRGDGYLQNLRLKRTQATDQHKKAELQWNKFIEQARSTGSGVSGLAAGNENLANNLQDLMVDISAEESAITNVKDEQKNYILKQLNENKHLRKVAGGDTQFGETKVLAQAQSGVTKMIMDNAKAMTSIFSNEGYNVDEMFKAQTKGGTLRNNEPVDEVGQLAAIQYVMENIGNNWAVEKTIDRMLRDNGMVMEKDADGNPVYGADGNPIYYDAKQYREAKINKTPLPNALDASEVAGRRDLLQMVVDGYRKGGNKVSWFASTMQESTNRGLSLIRWEDEEKVGRELTASEAAIITEARAGKYDANRITNMDPDELSRMIQALRDDKYRGLLTSDQRQSIITSIREAQTSPQTRHLIKPRERGLMGVLASYLELKGDRPTGGDELRNLENVYYEVERNDENGTYRVRVPKDTPGAKRVWSAMAAPTEYDMDRQDDIGPSNLGMYGSGPLGPDKRPYEDT